LVKIFFHSPFPTLHPQSLTGVGFLQLDRVVETKGKKKGKSGGKKKAQVKSKK
jgi:hypothetical protein